MNNIIKKDLNEMIYCKCGCGLQRTKYGKKGRKAFYIRGHYKPPSSKINKQILCQCGCETQIWQYDSQKRPRIFANGHNKKNFNDKKQNCEQPTEIDKKEIYKRKYIRAQKQKIELMAMFNSECLDCNIKLNEKNIAIFQFHHLDESQKKIYN